MDNDNRIPETSTYQSTSRNFTQEDGIPTRMSNSSSRTIHDNRRATRRVVQKTSLQNKQVFNKNIPQFRSGNKVRFNGYYQSSEEEIIECPICQGEHTQFECQYAICKECKQTGHTKRDCPLLTCKKCDQFGHRTEEHDSPCQECRQHGCYRKECRKTQEKKISTSFNNRNRIEQPRSNWNGILVKKRNCRYCNQTHRI